MRAQVLSTESWGLSLIWGQEFERKKGCLLTTGFLKIRDLGFGNPILPLGEVPIRQVYSILQAFTLVKARPVCSVTFPAYNACHSQDFTIAPNTSTSLSVSLVQHAIQGWFNHCSAGQTCWIRNATDPGSFKCSVKAESNVERHISHYVGVQCSAGLVSRSAEQAYQKPC